MVDLASPEARERIARALYSVRFEAETTPWKDLTEFARDLYRFHADAALSEVAAMLEEE